MEIMDWKSKWRKGTASSPFTSVGFKWCNHCKMAVDHDTQAEHKDTIYVYKTICLRCGGIIDKGIFDNVPLLNTQAPNFKMAIEWTMKPGQDRTGRRRG